MSIALTIVLIAFCVQGLVKFAVGFLVPYQTRINRIATYYRRDGRIISIYDSAHPRHHRRTRHPSVPHRHAGPQLHHRPGRRDAYHPDLLPPLRQTPCARAGARIRISAKESHVVRDPSPTRVGLERNPSDDGAVRLGSLRAHRPAGQVARQPVSVPHTPHVQSRTPRACKLCGVEAP